MKVEKDGVFVLELDTAHYLREVEQKDEDIFHSGFRYRNKEEITLRNQNRIYEVNNKSKGV